MTEPARDPRRETLPESERAGSLEEALWHAVRWVVPAAAVGAVALLFPQPMGDTLLPAVTFHLSALVVLGLAVTWDLSLLPSGGWFPALGSPGGRWLATNVTLVALIVGVVALVTLASSAALRLDPSLQFLQLLSAVDIAWVVAALTLGVKRLAGAGWAAVAGGVVAVVCVWAIWQYLNEVGFTASGGWQVDGPALFRYVLPYDMAAAVAALAALLGAARRHSRSPAGG